MKISQTVNKNVVLYASDPRYPDSVYLGAEDDLETVGFMISQCNKVVDGNPIDSVFAASMVAPLATASQG